MGYLDIGYTAIKNLHEKPLEKFYIRGINVTEEVLYNKSTGSFLIEPELVEKFRASSALEIVVPDSPKYRIPKDLT